MWMCFETSEMVELGRECSLNLAFRDLSVSPTYTTSHSSHLILYTGPTTFSLHMGFFGFANNCLSVFVGLKYVGMPYFPNTCSQLFQENFYVWDHDRRVFGNMAFQHILIQQTH